MSDKQQQSAREAFDAITVRQALVGGWVTFWRAFGVMMDIYAPWGKETKRVEGRWYNEPTWRGSLYGMLGAPCFGFEQAYFCYCFVLWRWPEWPGNIAMRLNEWLTAKAEAHSTSMHWHPPLDPTNRHEVGFWSPEIDREKCMARQCFIYQYDAYGNESARSAGEPSVLGAPE